MQGSPFQKILLMMTLAAIAVALLLQFINSRLTLQAELPAPKVAKAEVQDFYPPLQSKAPVQIQAPAEDATNTLDQLKIPRDKAEAWLARHNRNAASLLAVFRAQGDTNYLNEAATNFPNDPRVELAVLSRNAYPENRRKWLDLFKASSPSNSLANYLSAQDLFKNGKADEAVQELLAASGKSQFNNHGMETQLDAEELYLDSGKSAREAATLAMSAMAGEDLPQLAAIKQVDQGVADLIQQKLEAGDAGSAVNLAQLGMIMAANLNSGESGKYLINQLVGMASEAVVLSHLDQNTAYDFLDGRTPAQVLQENKQQKAALRELDTNFQAVYPSLTDAELNNYLQRSRIYGAIAAAQWVVQQHPPAAPQQ